MKRNKFGAVKTNGYASKLEARIAAQLKAALLPGQTLLEQVPIKFACGAKYIVDFAIMERGMIIRYVEVKGKWLPIYNLKLRMLKHEFPEIYAIHETLPPKKGTTNVNDNRTVRKVGDAANRSARKANRGPRNRPVGDGVAKLAAKARRSRKRADSAER